MADRTPDFDVSVGLFQDLEDLKAHIARLDSQVTTLMEAPAPDEPLADDNASLGNEPDNPDEPDASERKYPPLILLLEPPQYDDELRALIEWVEGVLVPAYLAEPSSEARWCHLWFEHLPAVARLHACWLAWQELTDPAGCGYTGPSVWHRDHLDPCIRELRGPQGPFRDCTKGEHQVNHRMPSLVPSSWRQD